MLSKMNKCVDVCGPYDENDMCNGNVVIGQPSQALAHVPLGDVTNSQRPTGRPKGRRPILTDACRRERPLTSSVNRPVSGSKRSSPRPTSSFGITLRLGMYYFSSIRDEIAGAAPDWNRCIVSIEKGELYGHCDYHAHCYFEFKEKYLIPDLIKYFTDILGPFGVTVDVQTIKNLRNYVTYITKEDVDCLYFCFRVSDFHFRYQSFYYLRRMDHFDYSHPFIVQNRQYHNFLKLLYNQIHSNWVKCYSYIWPWVLPDVDWVKKVENWYVNFVSTSYYFKKKHLYLYGDTNMGKSTLINLLICSLGNRIFYVKGQHYFADLCDDHKIIIWDEFPSSNYDHDLLKLAFGGSTFSINQKYVPERDYVIKQPVICLSNYPLRNYELASRFVIIKAEFCMFQHFFDQEVITEEVSTVFIEEDGDESDVSEKI